MIKHLQKLFALVLFCCFLSGSSTAWAQVQYEPFTGTGALINSAGWVHHSGASTGEIQIINGSLPTTNLPAPTGNKIAITASGNEDANLALSTAVTSGSVYASFLVKPESGFSANSTTGTYFLHFSATAGADAATFVTRVSIREGSAANTFNLGVLNNSGGTAAANVVFGANPVDYAVGQTYFVVVEYNIADKKSSIWINPTPGATEPAATVTNNFGTSTPANQVAGLAVRQASGTGNIEIDEIRIGTTWASVTPAGTPTSTPTITPSTGSVNLGDALIGAEAVGTYTLSAANIGASSNVVLTTTAPFAISTTATGTYSTSLTLTGAELATNKTIYVKAVPVVAGSITGKIIHTAAGATTAEVDLVLNGSDAYAQNFNVCSDQLPGGWIQRSVTGDQRWSCTTFGTSEPTTGILTNAVQMSGYEGGNKANEDWLISPKLDLSGYTIPVVSINYRTKFAGNALVVKVSTNYDGTGSPTTATWTTLATLEADNADVWKKLENLGLEGYKSANTYVAFVYTSTTESAARWTLDNFNVENVTRYFASPDVSHNFGIVEAWTPEAPLTFQTFKAVGFTQDLVITSTSLDPNTQSHLDFELSKTNTAGSYGETVTYTVAELNDGEDEKLYIRFLPKSTYITFKGAIKATSGTDFERILGTVTGSSILKENTLDVVTWNLEWFGSTSNGPSDEALQFENAKKAITALNADIIGVQEIADEAKMVQLAQQTGYEYVTEQVTGQQQLGFLYKPGVVTVKKEKVLLSKLYADIKAGTATLTDYPEGKPELFWSSGRLPYMVQFEATINGTKQTFNVVNIHAKANADQDMNPYNRRKYDVTVLKDSLEAQYASANLIILGDYNDDVDVSVVGSNNPSSFAALVTDEDFVPITLELSKTGAVTYESSSFKSFLDHIIISDELEDEYIEESVTIETQLLSLINSFRSTTSDHLPVSARFSLSATAAVSFAEATTTKTEAAGTFAVTLTMSSASAAAQTVTITTAAGGTASAADYTLTGATNGALTVTVPANATTATFEVSITDDTEDEENEQVVFNISSVSNDIQVGTVSSYTLVIEDNDSPTGLADATKGQFNVYPNPVDGTAGVRLALPERIAAQTKVNLTVYSLDGKKTLAISGTVAQVQQQLNKQSVNLKSGMYIMLVQAGKEYFQTKLIKQ